MYCAHCGRPVPSLARPCSYCGRPASGVPEHLATSSSKALIVIVIGVAGLMVVAIVGIIAAIAVPNFINAVNRGRQKRSMADIRSISTAVNAYAVDYNRYPAAETLPDLANTLTPTYLKDVPTTDGWNHNLYYECWQSSEAIEGCDHFMVVSPGRDGEFEYDEMGEYLDDGSVATRIFDCDIVFSDGGFIRYPEGTSRR